MNLIKKFASHLEDRKANMLDLNKIVNDEIQKAYLKGRREIASELRDILSKKNNNNAYKIDMQMIDKLSKELNRE